MFVGRSVQSDSFILITEGSILFLTLLRMMPHFSLFDYLLKNVCVNPFDQKGWCSHRRKYVRPAQSTLPVDNSDTSRCWHFVPLERSQIRYKDNKSRDRTPLHTASNNISRQLESQQYFCSCFEQAGSRNKLCFRRRRCRDLWNRNKRTWVRRNAYIQHTVVPAWSKASDPTTIKGQSDR